MFYTTREDAKKLPMNLSAHLVNRRNEKCSETNTEKNYEGYFILIVIS